jgi:hypothetical protein
MFPRSPRVPAARGRRRRGREPAHARSTRRPPQLFYPALALLAVVLVGVVVVDWLREPDSAQMQETLELILADIPRPSGAQVVSQRGFHRGGGARAVSIYTTGFGQMDIAEHYVRELAGQGWEQLPTRAVGRRLVFCRSAVQAEVAYTRGLGEDADATVELLLSSGSLATDC